VAGKNAGSGMIGCSRAHNVRLFGWMASRQIGRFAPFASTPSLGLPNWQNA
jgi:hypothetical protein